MEQLLAENPARERSRSADVEAEAEAIALYMTSRRLRRLRAQRAPDRLRHGAWNRAMAAPIQGKPRRSLWLTQTPPAWVVAAGRVAASLVAALTVGYGAVAASAASMPNSPLYPVKIVIEDIMIAVAPTEHRADLLLNQANRRLDESRVLADDGQMNRAERLVEDASQKIEGAKALAPIATDPGRTNQGIQIAVTRAALADESIERTKPAPSAVVVAPAAAPKPDPKPAVPAESPALNVDALQLPVEAPSLAAPAIDAATLPSGGTSSAPVPAIGAGQFGAPAAPAVQIIEQIEATLATPTRGGLSAPQETVIPLEQVVPAVTTTRTATPVRSPTPATPGSSTGTAGAPTSGVTVLPAGGPSGPTPSDSPRPPAR